jgi:hypothetical protein
MNKATGCGISLRRLMMMVIVTVMITTIIDYGCGGGSY